MAWRVVDGERDLVPVGAHEDELDERGQQGDDDEVQDGSREGKPPQSGTAGHADSGGLPDRRSGREASDCPVPGEDDARAEEADARHDL